MSEFNIINAAFREDVGKGASRRLRRSGRIPAVLYGGDKDPAALTLNHTEVIQATASEAFYSSILEIRVDDGRSQQVVVRDLQRHPFKQQILHMDFMRVSQTEVLRISVPLHFVGESSSPAGKTPGVVIQHQLTDVEISALPKDLPEYLEVDLSGLDAGGSVMLDEISMPEGVKLSGVSREEAAEVMVANAVHISESQGTGAAAAAEAEALAAEEGELGLEVAEEDAELEAAAEAPAEDEEGDKEE
jgi:large subunit ribosomal protein L25